MMLMQLLDTDELDPTRGDVIVFNNTSCEHPATYVFVRKMKALAERKNIPFFWVEYQTYEDAANDYSWHRKATYRLVNDQPYEPDDNKNGYRYKGEVFEELISHSGFMPSMFARSCTIAMKIIITNNFLSDWFAQKQGIEHQGHYGNNPRMSNQHIINRHKKYGGSVPDHILLAKSTFVRNQPFVRPAQSWSDYTNAGPITINNPTVTKYVLGDKAQLFGFGKSSRTLSYISYIGIRKDEEHRVKKIRLRIKAGTCNQPSGEIVVAPLVDAGIRAADITAFWKHQDFNLNLPDNGLFSNCLYCPLKGKNRLLEIAQAQRHMGSEIVDTGASINWWIDIEHRYSRDIKAENRVIKNPNVKFIGFFGSAPEHIYPKIKEGTDNKITGELLDDDVLTNCNCTD